MKLDELKLLEGTLGRALGTVDIYMSNMSLEAVTKIFDDFTKDFDHGREDDVESARVDGIRGMIDFVTNSNNVASDTELLSY